MNNILNNLNFHLDLNETLSDRFSKIILQHGFLSNLIPDYSTDLDNHFKISTGIEGKINFQIFLAL